MRRLPPRENPRLKRPVAPRIPEVFARAAGFSGSFRWCVLPPPVLDNLNGALVPHLAPVPAAASRSASAVRFAPSILGLLLTGHQPDQYLFVSSHIAPIIPEEYLHHSVSIRDVLKTPPPMDDSLAELFTNTRGGPVKLAFMG